MATDSEYAPSPTDYVRDTVEQYESSGGTEGNTMRGMPIIILTTVGNKSGKIRKTPLMRVEHDGLYLAVGSQGGAPEDPKWVANLRADPAVELQDGTVRQPMIAREITGEEREQWWERAVAAFPPYADYKKKTSRVIPVFVLEPAPR
jgi:F420H(2)-dependent quinone reductase